MNDIPAHFTDLIHKIAKEQNFDKYDLDIKPFSTGGANYTSHLYTVTISEGSNVLHLFGKIAAVGLKMRDRIPKVYTTERYCYTDLINLYDKIQNDNNVPDEHKLVFTKYYGCHPEVYKETIVLEDLAKKGYVTYDRLKPIDWPFAKAAVEEMVKMHAVSIAYSIYYPEDFKKIMKDFFFEWNLSDDTMKLHVENMVSRAVKLFDGKNTDKVSKFFETIFTLPDTFADDLKKSRRTVLGHGDFRPSNLMYKHRNDGKIDIKIVDLQTLQGGSPVTDLIYFIFTGSDEKFRAEYYDKLVDYYYTELSAAMRRLNIDPEETFSREDFDVELNEKLPFGLSLAVFSLPVITVAAEDAPEVNENLEISNFAVENTSKLYTERLNGIVNDYVKWGILK